MNARLQDNAAGAEVENLGAGEFVAIDPAYLKGQIDQIRYIYETAFPYHGIELHLWWEKSKLNTPNVFDQHDLYDARSFDETYIGCQVFGKRDAAAVKRVDVTIPSPEQDRGEPKSIEKWAVKDTSRLYRGLHKGSSLLTEEMNFLLELRHKWRQKRKVFFKRLTYTGNVMRPTELTRDKSKDPAILIGFHWLAVGGAESLAFDTVDWALEAGYRVIVTTDVKGPQPMINRLLEKDRVEVLRTDHYLPRNVVSAFFPRLVAKENIVAVHNHHSGMLYDALPTLRMHFPDLIALDSTHIIENVGGGYPRISGVWSNYLDHHHVISRDLKDFFRSEFRVNSKAVVGRLLDRSRREAELHPMNLSTGQKKVRVAFVGRMVHQKRPQLVVEAFRRLRKWGKSAGVEFTFDMVGDGPQLRLVDGLLRRYGLASSTRLHPPGTDVPALLKESDILLLMSANEGLTLVAYEAIEQGCIPISTDVGAQKELIPEDLLISWVPRRGLRGVTRTVKRLLTEQGFIERVQGELHENYRKIASEPTAHEVISEIYIKALSVAREK